jgi:tripartite-type tricarboxylate transporter receptor subunit TctC
MTRSRIRRESTAARAACAVLLAACLLRPAIARAEPVEEFYRGKQIVMLVASGVGGGYDTYARVFARHVGAHIPGNPAIVPKNLPAAGGLAAANTL